LRRKVETCGYLRPVGNGKYKAVEEGKGVVGDGNRVACTFKPPYEELLWHTHPIGVKAYPSAEDVMKVLKKRSNKRMIQRSFIYTAWGVWELYAAKKMDIPREDEKRLVEKINNKYSRPMYQATQRGRASHLTAKMHQAINRYIADVEHKFSNNGLKIILYNK
jgi:hypothetical protein